MRRFWKITGLVIIILLLLVVLSTSLVRRSSYFNEDYYKITKDRFDSIRTAMAEVKGTVEAGFSKINITPVINDSGNYLEGQFRSFPLAGYGDRKGNPATGVHNSIDKRLMVQPDNVYLQAIRIDDMVWITTPGNFSGEYVLQMKNILLAEGFKSNITSLNGSYVGYIVPGRYFYLGGYEPGLMGWFGRDMGEYMMDLIRQVSDIVTGIENL